ncbi:MAG: alpha/beta hydrolase [Alicyclobacillus sp.]|nr:alpha/beta hydrolase [Alicyclobacillus sp.]
MVIQSKFVVVDGIRTHYLEAGTGPTVVLLHSGEFGGCAEISWEFNIEALAAHFHVIAPDWLGFGRTDKIYDFAGGRKRVIQHMKRFLEVMAIEEADFIGNSMGGSNLARVAAEQPDLFPIRKMVIASGGGYAPFNEHRQALLEYDCTMEGMRRLLRAMMYHPKWAEDDKYVRRRYELSLLPGAWECTAAARFKSPAVPPRTHFGQPDQTPYENIRVPTLLVAGANDKLREPGYYEYGKRIPGARIVVLEECGHCPNIEKAEEFNRLVIEFLQEE